MLVAPLLGQQPDHPQLLKDVVMQIGSDRPALLLLTGQDLPRELLRQPEVAPDGDGRSTGPDDGTYTGNDQRPSKAVVLGCHTAIVKRREPAIWSTARAANSSTISSGLSA